MRPRASCKSCLWPARVLPLLRVVAAVRRLRGTRFDPFGCMAERRRERALISDYKQLVAEVIADLTSANHPAAIALLELARQVRATEWSKSKALPATSMP